MELTIRESQLADGWTSIAVEGEIDLATVGTLEDAIERVKLENTTMNLVVDLTESSFMDSTGLKALVNASRSFSEHGRMFAIAVSAGPVSRLIDLSGLSSSIRIVESTDELVSA
jgi:anti-anti-sigma factor